MGRHGEKMRTAPTTWELPQSEQVTGVTISRQRCLALLRDLNCPIIWVNAPAGTGKSHLLRQVAEESFRLRHLPADRGGRCRPWQILSSPHKGSVESEGQSPLPTFGSEQLIYLRNFALRFFKSIDGSAASDILVTLDDMHHLDPTPELLEALALLSAACQNTFRL